MPASPPGHWVLAALLTLAPTASSANALPTTHGFLEIKLPVASPAPVSGRLLLFAIPAAPGKTPDSVDADEFNPEQVTIAAQEVSNLAPGGAAEIDTDEDAYPSGFSALKPGNYAIQAVLDTRHDYAYAGRAAGDLTSDVALLTVGTAATHVPSLTLGHTIPQSDPWQQPPRVPAKIRALVEAARPYVTPIDFQSPALTRFWGRPISMRGWVLTPPSYAAQPTERYPTVYYTNGFGGALSSLLRPLAYVRAGEAQGDLPPVIWVFLDESSPTGTHEFADSVNNGPWGQALTTELIPSLEGRYRMEAKASERFLIGHSSGGWATLWLQTHYPSFFGGTWASSPDPSDFHDFMGTDIYAPNANAYRQPDGTPTPLVRMNGKVVATVEEVSRLEAVLGPSGGQMSSFEWVFSPRGPGGTPVPLFDRASGAVNPAVAAYWKANYDIANLVAIRWPQIHGDLTGKIHVMVGDADTFYLDGPARRLESTLNSLHAKAQFTYAPGRGHFDVYAKGNDEFGRFKDVVWQIYQTAKPNSTLRQPAAQTVSSAPPASNPATTSAHR
jgi:S-formylglutathione hydrolase FrmB